MAAANKNSFFICKLFYVNNGGYCFYRAGYAEGCKIKNIFLISIIRKIRYLRNSRYLILTNIYQQLAN